jgi:hypothetical protein
MSMRSDNFIVMVRLRERRYKEETLDRRPSKKRSNYTLYVQDEGELPDHPWLKYNCLKSNDIVRAHVI